MKTIRCNILFILAAVVSLSGCRTPNRILTNTLNQGDLSYLAAYPNELKQSDEKEWKNKTVIFNAMVTSKEIEVDMEGGKVSNGEYIAVSIPYNVEREILVNIKDVNEVPESKIVRITGRIEGNLYSTARTGTMEYLNITATEISSYRPAEKEIVTARTFISEKQVEYEILEAHSGMNSMEQEVLYISFNIKNQGKDTAMCHLTDFFVFQGEDLLVPTSFYDEQDPRLDRQSVQPYTMLESNRAGTAFAVYELANNSDEISICMYDDDFSLIYEYNLLINKAQH